MALLQLKLPFSQKWEPLFLDILRWLCIFIVYAFMQGSRTSISADIFFSSILLGLVAYHLVLLELLEFEYIF